MSVKNHVLVCFEKRGLMVSAWRFSILAWMLLWLTSLPVFAQDGQQSADDGFLKAVGYGKPFVAETHSTMTKIEIGFSQVLNEYNISADYTYNNRKIDKLFVEAHLGVELPIYSWTILDGDGRPSWGFALSMPLSMHVFEDMFESLSAPVINTDYRFGVPMLKAIRRFSGGGFLKNLSLTWRPWSHECTHLGDEITIFRKDIAVPITRINVSYEYTELQLALNDPDGQKDNRHSIKLGGLLRISDRGLGWYDVDVESEAVDTIDLAHSQTWFEYWLQYQWQRTDGFLASDRIMNVISIEIRSRVKYGVPTFRWVDDAWRATNHVEAHKFCINAYLGYRFFPSDDSLHGLGLYFHGYYGLNPWGQLRNIYPYRFFGLALTHQY